MFTVAQNFQIVQTCFDNIFIDSHISVSRFDDDYEKYNEQRRILYVKEDARYRFCINACYVALIILIILLFK